MTEPTGKGDPANKGRAMYDEADIGSGEKAPGQHETEAMIREIPPLPAAPKPDQGDGDEAADKRQQTGA